MTTPAMPRTRLDHGAIGNGRVLALVAPSSAIEWLCLPRFDSPSVFGRLLDADRGGTFRFLSQGQELRGQLEYVRNTNVLSTRFEAGATAWEVIDFAPRIPSGLTMRVPIEIMRIVRPLRGQPRLSVDFDPRPDYSRADAALLEGADAIEILGAARPLYLYSNLPQPYILNRREFALTDSIYFILSYGRRDADASLAQVLQALELTIAEWRRWVKTCTLPVFAGEHVLRSALCLKLHAYHDTGAVIAAATTSIPEAMGTPRTWDYRYCWLRDAAFVVEALRRLGFLNEGEQFIRFLRDVVETGPLQPVYGIGGERALEEQMLPHLAGFDGNGHVRIGNAAAQQTQNDLMGEMILCLDTLLKDPRVVLTDPESYFPLIEHLVEMALRVAPVADMGIWEFRTIMRPYTFSRAMCWVAAHRGAMIARHFGHTEQAERWESAARAEHRILLERGYNATLGFFTQTLDGVHPDASNLLLPALGVIEAHDPRFVSTVAASERLLVEGGFVLRYRNADDFGATTSAFTICSFWLAEALALTGRLDAAIALFEHLTAHANPVGLFSEDIEPSSGVLLGNFPQAYTHVGLIHAAMTIGTLIETRDSRVRAWG